MEILHVHQSGTHKYTLSLILKIIQTPRQMDIHLFHMSCTLTLHYLQYSSSNHSLLNTLEKTDATEDGNKSSSSVRYTNSHTLSLLYS